MLKFIKSISVLVLFSLLIFGCDTAESNLASSTDPLESVSEKSKSIYNATVDKIEIETKNSFEIYEVYMSSQKASNVKIEFERSSLIVLEIYGESPPFKYELFPGMGLLNFSNVKSIASNSQQGNLTEWKLEKDDSNNRWEYRFWISNNSKQYKLRVDAVNGNVLEIKEV